MSPYSLEIDISSSFFLHFQQGNGRKYQDLASLCVGMKIRVFVRIYYSITNKAL